MQGTAHPCKSPFSLLSSMQVQMGGRRFTCYVGVGGWGCSGVHSSAIPPRHTPLVWFVKFQGGIWGSLSILIDLESTQHATVVAEFCDQHKLTTR